MTWPVPADSASADDRTGRSLVLVAAADSMVRAAIASVLRYAGFRVAEAWNGNVAVAACHARPGEFAAALMDVRMPGLDGVGATGAIRRSDPNVRCFLMTGGHCDRAELERAGADRVFGKPLDFPEVIRAITDAIAGGMDEEARPGAPADREARTDGVA